MTIPGQVRALASIGSTRTVAPRKSSCIASSAIAICICICGCAPSSVPSLSAGMAPIETGATDHALSGQVAADTAIFVGGTPTEIYALVARGALGCWFAPNGPLKASHVFHADAAPPSQGGRAEIVLHERDVALADRRGARSFHVTFTGDATGVRVGISVIKLAPALAELMKRDVEAWAKGDTGCQAQALSPSTAVAPPQPGLKSSRSGGR